MCPIASSRVEVICMLCFSLQSTLQLVSIPEDEHVNIALFRNNTHLTDTSRHAFKSGKGQSSYEAMRKKEQSVHVCQCTMSKSHSHERMLRNEYEII